MHLLEICNIKLKDVPGVGELKFSKAQKNLRKVPVAESASWGMCQLGDRLEKLRLGLFFSNFVGGKNLSSFQR